MSPVSYTLAGFHLDWFLRDENLFGSTLNDHPTPASTNQMRVSLIRMTLQISSLKALPSMMTERCIWAVFDTDRSFESAMMSRK